MKPTLKNGPLTTSGNIDIDFGADGPGDVTITNFNADGSVAGGVLSSNGQVLQYNSTGSTFNAVRPDGTLVFTISIDDNGNFTFTQYEQLDHANGNDPNDVIRLNFSVRATDGDGDGLDTTIRVFDCG